MARTRYHLECRTYPRLLNAVLVATGDVNTLRNACGGFSLGGIALTTEAKSWSEQNVEVAACTAPLRPSWIPLAGIPATCADPI